MNLPALRAHCLPLLLLLSPAAASSSSSPSIPRIPASAAMADSNDDADNAAEPASSYKRVLFSDIDGTLVHYPRLPKGGAENDGKGDGKLMYLPPSKTGTRGVISARTLQLCHRLRHGAPSSDPDRDGTGGTSVSSEQQRINNGGVPLVLISGARTTTLLQRLPYLPRADAYVSESGGRIFYPLPVSNKVGDGKEAVDGLVEGLTVQPMSYPGISPSDETPFSLVEDMHWRDRISQLHAAGQDGYDDKVPIEEREGKLWDFAQTLMKRGYVLDFSGYATAYRINRKHQNAELSSTFDEFIEKCAKKEGIPKELGCSTNLGCVDVYPNMSGKKNCAEYLVQKFLGGEEGGETPKGEIALKTHAYCMCDDDNDIEMALACRAAYLPSITSDSIRELVKSQTDGRLVVTEDETKGIVESLATEAALEAIANELR